VIEALKDYVARGNRGWVGRVWLREDGTLSRGADDVAALRQAICDFLEDFIETLREETR
jgi:hypothetical protein